MINPCRTCGIPPRKSSTVTTINLKCCHREVYVEHNIPDVVQYRRLNAVAIAKWNNINPLGSNESRWVAFKRNVASVFGSIF